MTGRSDLLADLRVDRARLQPAPPAPAPEAPATTATATSSPAAPPSVARTPALELRVTPLEWSRPALAHEGSAWTVRLGPWHAALVLP